MCAAIDKPSEFSNTYRDIYYRRHILFTKKIDITIVQENNGKNETKGIRFSVSIINHNLSFLKNEQKSFLFFESIYTDSDLHRCL